MCDVCPSVLCSPISSLLSLQSHCCPWWDPGWSCHLQIFWVKLELCSSHEHSHGRTTGPAEGWGTIPVGALLLRSSAEDVMLPPLACRSLNLLQTFCRPRSVSFWTSFMDMMVANIALQYMSTALADPYSFRVGVVLLEGSDLVLRYMSELGSGPGWT